MHILRQGCTVGVSRGRALHSMPGNKMLTVALMYTCAWWPITQDTLGMVNAKRDKLLRVKHGQLNHFPHLVNLLFTAANVTVSRIWLLLHRHHCHTRVNLRWQGNLDLVLGSINPAGGRGESSRDRQQVSVLMGKCEGNGSCIGVRGVVA